MHECKRGAGTVTRYNECKNRASRLTTPAEGWERFPRKLYLSWIAKNENSRARRRVGQGFRTDHVQSTKGRGSRKILGARSETGWRAQRLILTTLGSSAIGSDDREDLFLRGLELRVVATTGRRVKGPGALGQVSTPLWGLGFLPGNRRPLPERDSLRRHKWTGLWTSDR